IRVTPPPRLLFSRNQQGSAASFGIPLSSNYLGQNTPVAHGVCHYEDALMGTLGSPVILLAEDLEEDIIIIERAFKQVYVPHRLMVVHNGEDVVRYLMGQDKYADRKTYPFPMLLLLDLKMPGTDGFEILKWLRDIP